MNLRFLVHGAAVWVLLPFIAVANGALREFVLLPLMGAGVEIASVLTLLIAVYALTGVFLRLERQPYGSRETWTLGAIWAGLTVAFEFVFFGVVMGEPFEHLLAAYNLLAGRVWALVVAGVFLAPRLMAPRRRRGA